MDALTDFKNTRAFDEGYAAYLAKIARHAPARFGVFSGKWVEGWEASATNSIDCKALRRA